MSRRLHRQRQERLQAWQLYQDYSGKQLKSIPEEHSLRFSVRSAISCSSGCFSTTSSELQDDDGHFLMFPGRLEQEAEHEQDLLLINRSRMYRKLIPLQRNPQLDAIAQRHAERMASTEKVYHSVSNVEQLKGKLRSDNVGENVQRGKSKNSMHQYILRAGSDSFLYNNMMSRKYSEVGLGTAIGKRDGLLYWVQLYRSS